MLEQKGFIHCIDKDGNKISFTQRSVVYIKEQSDGDIEVRTTTGVEIVREIVS